MSDEPGRGNVRVVARFRPQMPKELAKNGIDVTNFDGSGKSVTIDGQRKAAFTFDRVFNKDSTQEEVYEYAAKPIIEDVLRGYNGTLFAYGQTGSGKTHTMEGSDPDSEHRGLIPRIIHAIFGYVEIAPDSYEFTVRVSYFEIYMEKIRDLLCDGNDNLQIHENRERGVYVRHATELFMQDPEEVMDVMRAGAFRRSVASTNMNDQSSRSHSVFLLELTQKDTIKGGTKTGKLYLVDLAGSEKVSKTGADGEVLEEAKNINKSLSALGLVIMSLTDGTNRQHVPYRDSKLTRILQESLGGNSRTTIVICCSPSSYNEQETFSTLRFGQRAKKIKNHASVNVQYSAQELQKQLDAAKKEIRKLAKRLAAAEAELQIWRTGGSVSEEDRVQLTTPDDAPIATELAQGEDSGWVGRAGAAPAGVSDKEREEFMAREKELLDLLDDKDEHIRSLEREIEVLGQDKVTITKLAAENAQQRANIQELEERVEETMAENAEYEITIEDMARANSSLDEELARMKEEREKMLKDFEMQHGKFQTQTQSIAEMVASLAQPKQGRQLPATPGSKETGTVVDAQFSKARAFVTQLQTERDQLKQSVDDTEAAKDELEKTIGDVRQELSESKLLNEQIEGKLTALTSENTSMSTQLKDFEKKNEELRSETESLLGRMVSMQSTLKETEESAKGGNAMAEEMKAKLDEQQRQQREEHAKNIAELRQQLESSKADLVKSGEEKGKVELELNRLKGEMEKVKQSADKQQEKIVQFTQKQEKEEQLERETKGVSEATKQQMEVYEQLKNKMRQNLVDRLKSGALKARMQAMMDKGSAAAAAGGAGGAGENGENGAGGEQSKHVVYLEKTNRELQQQYQDLQKSMAQVQRENAILQKKMQARGDRIKNLEAMMKKGEERLQKQFQIYQDENERLKKQGPQRHVIRKKSVKGNKSEQVTAIRGKSRVGAGRDSEKTFWNSQGEGGGRKGSGTVDASGAGAAAMGRTDSSSGIVGQGRPMVGKHAKKEVKGVDPLAVEFV